MLTDNSVRGFTAHIAGQQHAMAGAAIAASSALASSLGEACMRISILNLEGVEQRAIAETVAERLGNIRSELLTLADEDGAAIIAFAAMRETEGELSPDENLLRRQDGLCRMPAETGRLSAEAASLLQDFRPLVKVVQDDLEMAIALLDGCAHAAALLLDSNLRLWPDPVLLAKYEPELAALREQAARVMPVERMRR